MAIFEVLLLLIMADPEHPFDPKPVERLVETDTTVDTEIATLIAEAVAGLSERKTADALTTTEAITDLRSEMGLDAQRRDVVSSNLPVTQNRLQERLLGDFAAAERMPEGLLVMPAEIVTEVRQGVEAHRKAKRFSMPSFATGSPTDTRYDSKASNYSTRTKILELADGRRVFSVYNYEFSQVHRLFDRFIKTLAGRERHKVSHGRWKAKFEGKSKIPTIQNEHPDVVLMPYIPNMNANDLFRRNKTMTDHGELPWAKDLTSEDKLVLRERIIDALAKVHEETGAGWGETILQNVIITPEGEPIIVDPEVEFNDRVSVEEQKMDDLKEMIYSLTGAIQVSEGVTDVTTVVHRFLTRYPDQTIVQQLCDTTSNKFSWLRKIQLKLHDLNYFGVSLETYQAITTAIKSYTAQS